MLRNREVKTHRGVDTRARGRPRERRPRTRVPAAVRAGTRVCGRQEGGVARPRWKRTWLLRKLDANSAFETGVPRLMFSQEKLKKKKNMCLYNNLHRDNHNSFILHSSKREPTHISVNMLWNIQRRVTMTPRTTQMNLENVVLIRGSEAQRSTCRMNPCDM